MKKIKITVSVNGNEVTREYIQTAERVDFWNEIINSMLDTLEKSNKVKF